MSRTELRQELDAIGMKNEGEFPTQAVDYLMHLAFHKGTLLPDSDQVLIELSPTELQALRLNQPTVQIEQLVEEEVILKGDSPRFVSVKVIKEKEKVSLLVKLSDAEYQKFLDKQGRKLLKLVKEDEEPTLSTEADLRGEAEKYLTDLREIYKQMHIHHATPGNERKAKALASLAIEFIQQIPSDATLDGTRTWSLSDYYTFVSENPGIVDNTEQFVSDKNNKDVVTRFFGIIKNLLSDKGQVDVNLVSDENFFYVFSNFHTQATEISGF